MLTLKEPHVVFVCPKMYPVWMAGRYHVFPKCTKLTRHGGTVSLLRTRRVVCSLVIEHELHVPFKPPLTRRLLVSRECSLASDPRSIHHAMI